MQQECDMQRANLILEKVLHVLFTLLAVSTQVWPGPSAAGRQTLKTFTI